MAKHRWSVPAARKELTNWLKWDIAYYLRVLGEAKNQLTNAADSSQLILSNRLPVIAGHLGNEGALKVLEDDAAGWINIHRSYLYRYLGQRILTIHSKREGSAREDIPAFALILACAMATDDDSSVRKMGERFLCHPTIDLWSGFYHFVAWLYGRWSNQPVDLTRRELGRYQALVDCWESDDEEELQRVMIDLCEYHCLHSTLGRLGEADEFQVHPFSHFPVEILAIMNIRRREGRSTPVIDHPLMKTPLASPPKPLPEFHDPLLEQIVAHVKQALPEV